MASINSYLTFNGNCREAMTFYQGCLGGELTFETIGESLIVDKMPNIMKRSIMHAVLAKDDLVIMATDMVEERGLIKGNSIAMMLNCNSEEEAQAFYRKLSAGGKASHPLQETFWGALFGDLTDRFGNNWLINYDKNK
ncbi:VOC family protein [Pedobacter sp. ISL-68]|uniref:VOC family protein n=1 Tax=unclassified Pedobacter TaxID=2628915 RepID=UPI001BE97820|nr:MULTISPECIES: VOC family protein [unclassified Pedobacter]MBT2563651.1 VOC family protein [Pedobacter sp. ISL-64]MBT2589543.1 VOC family protein [Pedobacter sp. ISL-68]